MDKTLRRIDSFEILVEPGQLQDHRQKAEKLLATINWRHLLELDVLGLAGLALPEEANAAAAPSMKPAQTGNSKPKGELQMPDDQQTQNDEQALNNLNLKIADKENDGDRSGSPTLSRLNLPSVALMQHSLAEQNSSKG